MKPTLGWYLNRARAMSPAEVIYRLGQQRRKRQWRARLAQGAEGRTAPAHWPSMPQDTIAPDFPQKDNERLALLAEADSYLLHQWWFFGLTGLAEQPINWLADPVSGIIAPARFAFDIDHRDPAVVGNIKVIWEKNRHHHLTVLAAAYALTRDERYSAEVADQLQDWLGQNPWMIGVNWHQPLEAGIRLISWVWCERLLRGSAHHSRVFGPGSPLWTSVHHHQEFIEQAYARGSSANNHLIGEMAGLFIASTAWPVFEESARWRELSRGKLEREILRQTFPSGINREMAFSYHVFALEFFLLALAEAGRAGTGFSDDYRTRTVDMLEAMASLTDAGGHLPRYGDGDEGRAIQLQAIGGRRDGWLYHAGNALLGAGDPPVQEGRLAACLLGLKEERHLRGAPPPARSRAFEDAGLYLLTNRRGTSREVFVLADAGPHGYLSIAAHAHADALSFTLSAGGKPILIDPGTYVYHADERWRTYFRGTRAHNTVTIDDQDQSVQAGTFLWTKRARATVQRWEAGEAGAALTASHDGYGRLGVIHRRSFKLRDDTLVITDTLSGTGSHRAALCFHAAPECRVEQTAPSAVGIERDGVRVRLALDGSLQVRLARGEPQAGWYSPLFGVKEPTCTVLAEWSGPLPAAFTVTAEIEHDGR